MGAVCAAGVAGFTWAGGVAGFGVSALGVAVCAAGVAGFTCAGSVAGFGASVLGAVCAAGACFVPGAAAVPGFCGFVFTATSAGIVLGTGWLPVIRVPFARWGILVITGAADAPYGAKPRNSDASSPAATVFATVLFIPL